MLKNVTWHESNHFGGKKIEKEVAWLGLELTTFILEVESAWPFWPLCNQPTCLWKYCQKNSQHFGLSKKAALLSNFCIIGKIHHNFLVPRMIELGCKTFMPIQTFDLHRVILSVIRSKWLLLCHATFLSGSGIVKSFYQ